MKLCTLDFETYFADDYTLRKMTTEEYIRDERFEALCLGLKIGNNPAVCVDKFPKPSGLEQFGVVAHHAHFDGLICSHHFGARPAFWFDTLSMARLVHPHEKSHSLAALATRYRLPDKTVPYQDFKGKRRSQIDDGLWGNLKEGCKQDVEITHALFKALRPHVPTSELRLIDLTIRLFTEPAFCLDKEMLEEYLQDEQIRKADLLRQIGATEETLQSADKFADLLRSLGVEPPTKVSPKTGKVAYAFAKTDDGLKELLDGDNEVVADVVAARLGVKSTIGETRAERLLGMHERGPLPVYLKVAGAHTLRWSGGDKMNWQNFPRASAHRMALKAPDGFKIVVADLSQIECRENAWLSGEQWVLDAFAGGRDIYCEMASEIYGRTVTKDDKKERFVGKTTILGAGYGMGWQKFKIACRGQRVVLSDAEAERAISAYRAKHPAIVANWRYGQDVLAALYTGKAPNFKWGPMEIEGKKIKLPNGSYLDYSTLSYDGREFWMESRGKKSRMYGPKLVENVVQALSRIVIGEAMLRISERYKILLTVHDEVAYLAKDDEAEQAYQYGLEQMRTPLVWNKGIILNAEGGHDVRYSK